MSFILEHFWIAFIIATFINGLILKQRSKKYIKENENLTEGYKKYFKGFIFFGNLPWIIMGIGDISGMTNNTFDFFYPRDMNPIVLIFHATVIFLWILLIWWTYFKGGAEFMEKHPGLIQSTGFGASDKVSAKYIKIIVPFTISGGIMGMIMMWFYF